MPAKKPIKTKRNKSPSGSATYNEGTQLFPQLRPKNAILFESFLDAWADLNSEEDRGRQISICRWIFRNVPPITSAILDIAKYSVGNAWQPRFLGKDQEWGKQATGWLTNWFSIGNVKGCGFDLWTDLKIASYDIDVKGDILLVLSFAEDGKYPKWQWIPAEQIGNRSKQSVITKGEFAGYRIEHGCITDGFKTVGYQVLGDTVDDDVTVSTDDAVLLSEFRDVTQLRGDPSLVNALTTVRDYRTWLDNEREKAKILSSQVMSVETVAGEASLDPSSVMSSGNASDIDAVYGKYIRGSSIQIFKAGAGEKITPIEHSNPSTNAQEFMSSVLLRSAYSALEWPLEMYDVSALRNGPVRFIKERALAKILSRQETLSIAYLRLVRYGISKAISLGLLPSNPDFLEWGYQLPAEISIDAGRDSAASLNEINAFAKTYREHYGEKGEDWREAMDQRAYEEVYREFAKRKALEVLNGESNKADTTTGQPSSETGQVGQVGTEEEETMRDYLEAYGVAVRAGAITPSIADEESVRAKLGLPPVNEEVRKVWAEENNTRRPITLKGGKEEQQVVVEDEDEGETEQ